MTTTDVSGLTIAEAAELIRKRKLSPVELTEACLERISRLDARLHAFITVTGPEALSHAHQAANAIVSGSYKGPLHGIPIALKDLFDTAGLKTTAGSRIMAERVPTEDATIVARLRDAGAIVLGKLNMHEFAFGATGVNPHYGAARNPWDNSRVSGGSSSGSGVAVATGMTMAAPGTDTGGSVRIPAALCGITGLKPTFGRVSRRGVVPLSWSLDHVGPLTRSAADAAIMLQAMAGHDPADPASSAEPVPDYLRELEDRRLKGVRIGVPREHFFDNVDGDIMSAVEGAVQTLVGMKAEVSEISLPRMQELPAAATAIMLPEALAYHQRWLTERPEDYGEDVRGRLELGAPYSAVTYVQAQRFRSLATEEWREEVFGQVDLLVAPTVPIPAPSIDDAALQSTLNLVRLTNPLNLLGLPAVSLPCGFTPEGMPVGLQLIGGWFDEATVLRVASAYQLETDWHRRQPPV